MRLGSRFAAAAGAATLVVGLSACGADEPKSEAEWFASLSPERMLENGASAMRRLTSYRVRMEGESEGTAIAMDVRVDGFGQCSGELVVDDVPVQVIHTSDATYLKGSAQYWKGVAGQSNADFLSAVTGRWAKADRIPAMARPCELERMLDELGQLVADHDADDFTVRTALDQGRRVIKLTDPDESGFIYFSQKSPHRILSVSAGDDMRLDYSEFNEPVEISAPTDSVELTALPAT